MSLSKYLKTMPKNKRHVIKLAEMMQFNKPSAYRGYDLEISDMDTVLKTESFPFKMDGYKLWFDEELMEHTQADINCDLKAEHVKRNINNLANRLYEKHEEVQKNAPEEIKEQIYNVGGKHINKIVVTGDRIQAEFMGENPEEERDIFNALNAVMAWAAMTLNHHELKLKKQLMEGTLEIGTQTGSLYIIQNGEPVMLKDTDLVKLGAVKKTLFFITERYKFNPAYRAELNCSTEVNGFIGEYKKGNFILRKAHGEMTQVEKGIKADLDKYFEMCQKGEISNG